MYIYKLYLGTDRSCQNLKKMRDDFYVWARFGPNLGTDEGWGGKRFPGLLCNQLKGNNVFGRGERIRTSGSCVPNAVLYQAELHPVTDQERNSNSPHDCLH